MAKRTEKWRYEDATKTIRSVPENYWIASMDSWDGAVDHAASIRLILAAHELLRNLRNVVNLYEQLQGHETAYSREARAAIARAEG